jgi:Flp pilus assembly protein TadD
VTGLVLAALLGATDAETAQVYLEVARAEMAAGAEDAAIFALQQALEEDPDLAEARQALEAISERKARRTRVEQGLQLQEARRFAEALSVWEALLRERPDPALSLLAGAALVELGRVDDARRRLAEAQVDPRYRPAASLLLGVLELREGRGAQAVTALRFVSGSDDPRMRGAGAGLLRLAHRAARLSLAAYVQGEADSNVRLLPDDSTPEPLPRADGAAAVGAHLSFRPLGSAGPYGRLDGTFRKQAREVSFDYATAGGAVGIRGGSLPRFVALEYGFSGGLLGGAPLFTAHHLGLEGRWTVGRVALRGGWQGRLEQFRSEGTRRFSGPRQLGGAGIDLQLGRAVLGAGWRLDRALASEPELASLSHGPELELSLWPSPRWRLFGRAGGFGRTWDAYDPDLMTFRQDSGVAVDLAAELSLGERWRLRAGGNGAWTRSNVQGLQWQRYGAFLGVAFDAAVL